MDKPEGLTGKPVFIVKDMPIGTALRGYHSLLPATVNIRLERCDEERQTVDHKPIESWLDFGITSSLWNDSRTRILFPVPGLVNLKEIAPPFTAAKLSQLSSLAAFHHNSLYDYCVHQKSPHGPRGRRPEPCEKTGFKYGDAWLVRPLPVDFLARLREVFADADPDHIYDSGEDN